MGRPPCCDRVGIKKGPWTPEEDIILVSYIQEHGPGNWRSVPTNTGLLRCSKSCRLRWTNYLRPGIKRGNFTPHEEGMIVHLQALLGNKWAAIASYLPQRTDNDIKNYWNTHLKKKLKKFQSGLDPKVPSDSTNYQFMSMSFSDNNRHVSALKLNQTSSLYASSAENISRLLEGWMKSSPKSSTLLSPQQEQLRTDGSSVGNNCNGSNSVAPNSIQCYRPHIRQEEEIIISNDEFETILSFDNLNGMGWEKSSSNSIQKEADSSGVDDKTDIDKEEEEEEEEEKLENHPPLSFIENWLLDETAGHVNVEEAMEFPTMF